MNRPLKTQGFAQGIYQQSSTQIHDLDTVRCLADGRVFAYAQAGATALAVAKLTCCEAPSATANRETVYANAAVGDTVVYVTFGAEKAADLFKDGWIYDCIAGDLYRVKTHATGTTALAIYLKEPLRVAWTSSTSKATLIRNRQKYVIVSPTTLTSPPAGVAPIAVTAYYYFWNQVKGPATCLIAGTAVIGNNVGPLTTAGAVAPLNSADIIGAVGTVLSVDATTEYALINLAIPGY
jgi:hypothetical protein